MHRIIRHSAPSQRFEIGDQVILEPDLEGTIVGIRYGEPSYDVQVSGICLHNVPPDQLRFRTRPELWGPLHPSMPVKPFTIAAISCERIHSTDLLV